MRGKVVNQQSYASGTPLTYALGHHLRAVVCCLEHGYMEDIHAFDLRQRCVVLSDFGIGPQVEDLGDSQLSEGTLA